jgi:glucose-6-phosphate isomerase
VSWELRLGGAYDDLLHSSLRALAANDVIGRMWNQDYTIWKPEPTEISNRLGWLRAPERMLQELPRLEDLVEEVRSAGYSQVLLLGMGGSSLAALVFSKLFGKVDGYPGITVLDSIVPDTVVAVREKLGMKETLFIVSSKSGGTIETISLLKYFYGQVVESLGRDKAGRQFIAITEPGTDLDSMAERSNFRGRILSDPNIGGRYSALSYDGLVPAALMGVDISRLLGEAATAATACQRGAELTDNPGATLGAILGEMANSGRDKATLVTSPRLESFGSWLEQLIAESTGKEGRGILPVLGEPLESPEAYGSDRLFVSLLFEGERNPSGAANGLSALEAAGHPVVRLWMHDPYELGGQFFVWEVACAVAGRVMGVNPFDQPNVESAKALTLEMVADFKARGRLPTPEPNATADGVAIYGDAAGDTPSSMLASFLKGAVPGSYVAIQGYVQQTDATDRHLLELRRLLLQRLRLATTIGYGPRFLHSTGQLHKADGGRGLFVQVTCDDVENPAVPDELGSSSSSLSFGLLKEAEALGDKQALVTAGRRVIRFHFGRSVPEGLNGLTSGLSRLLDPSA